MAVPAQGTDQFMGAEANGQAHAPDYLRGVYQAVKDLQGRDGLLRDHPHLRAATEQLVALAEELWQRETVVVLRQREQLEEAVREAQATQFRYHELLEFAPDACLVTDTTGIISEANLAATALFQTNKEFLVGKPLPFLFRQDARAELYARLAELRQGGRALDAWEARVDPARRPDVFVDISVAAVGDAQGRQTGFRWLLRDISRRKQEDLALVAEKNFIESLIEMAPAVVLLLDADGRIRRTNRYLATLSGWSWADLQDREWCRALIAERDWPAAHRMFARTLLQGTSTGEIYGLRTADGRERTITWSAKALTRRAGETVLLTGQDITELQEAQQHALQMERLAAIGQMMTGLVHESRNALQRSQACLEMLDWETQGQPRCRDLVARIQKAQDDLHRLFEEVRQYAAPLQLARVSADLSEVWRQAWTELESQRAGRDVELIEEASRIPPECEVDRFRMGQVFRNILENALAACTDPVRVTVRWWETTLADRPALCVAIHDNGPGLNAEQRQKIFDPFYTTKTKGTGLGMAIAKRIVDAHGGRIAVGNPSARGAEIILTVPQRASA